MAKLPAYLIVLTTLSFASIHCASTSTKTGHSIMKNKQGHSISVANLDCCDDFKQQVITLDSLREVIILVHGCKASSGHFLTLREVFEARGQQAICFSYNYRTSIESCARQLVLAINVVEKILNPPGITIVAHSQGGLVARRALSYPRQDRLALNTASPKVRLVTISSPFNGINASSHCGINPLHVASAGMTLLVCQLIAGSTWSEIHPKSDFINNPGSLYNLISTHIKINTDEENTCRRVSENGACLENDFVFSLGEQYNDIVDGDDRVVNIELKAGHAQIVGGRGRPPFKLIEVLEEHRVLQSRTYLSLDKETALFHVLYR